MSLQIWLPLDGRLDNFGLADVTVTNSGATIDNNGKIGKCYYFNGTNARIYANNVSISNSQMTGCCWVKAESLSNSSYPYLFSLGSNTSGTGQQIGIYYYSSNNALYMAANGSQLNAKNSILSLNTWYHICFTYKGSSSKLYINGQLVSSMTNANSPKIQTCFCVGARSNSTSGAGNAIANPFQGWINDIRIYDHCLSPKQVKQISKGLVRHYPLNEIIGKPNLLQSVPKDHVSTAYCAYKLNLSQNLEANKTYTLQLWDVYNKNTGNSSYIGVYWGGGEVTLVNSVISQATVFTSTNFYKKYIKVSFTPTSTNASHVDAQKAQLWFYNINSSTRDYMEIGKWKLEEGSEATPWIPNINDAEYSSYDLGNVVYDCSGYGRNGTLSPTPPTYGSQSPRYFNCMAFNGTNNYIDCGMSNNGNLPTDAITVCGWGYKENWDSDTQQRLISCTQSGGFNFQGKTIQFIIYRNGSYAYATSSLVKTTGWYFFAGTYDGYVAKFYINGQPMTSSNDTSATSTKYPISYNSNAKLLIGCEPLGSTPSSPYWNGKISDIRIYCTALSAQDIKELYQSSLSVDNMGNFHTHEIFENTEAQS